MNIEELELSLQQYASSQMVDANMPDVKLYLEKSIEYNTIILTMAHRIPTKILQQDREICRYPASNWQWFKQFIPFAKPKYRIHYLTEHLTFPSIKLPENLQERMKIYIQEGMRTGNWPKDELCD